MKSIMMVAAVALLMTAAPAQTNFDEPPGEVLAPGTAEMLNDGYLLLPRARGRTHVCGEFYPADGPAVRPKAGPLMELRVATDGTVHDVKVIKPSGNAALDKAAVTCVRSWLYEPAEFHGKPIDLVIRNNVGWTPSEPVKPEPVNTITTQTRAASPSPISSPASIGKPHVCLELYPLEALLALQEGTTTLSFTITDEGTVANPVVFTSSGYPALDQASLQCVKDWRYKPAVKDGKPIAVPWKVQVRWALAGWRPQPFPQRLGRWRVCTDAYPESARAAHAEGIIYVSFVVDSAGRVTKLKVTQSSGNKALDAATVTCIAERHYVPAVVDGKPVDMPWEENVVWTLPPVADAPRPAQ